MYKFPRILLTNLVVAIFIFGLVDFVDAQNAPPPPPPPPPPKLSPEKPGAKVRGRLVYEDSGLPFRYASIGLIKVDSLRNTYGTSFVKTDENGDFLLEDVSAGEYYPYIKNEGVLNPDAFHTLNRFDKDSIRPEEVFQKIKVSGTGEFQVFIRAKRGGSVSGVVKYFDGERAVGVKVEALKQIDEKFLAYPVGKATTDDRGYYRFPALPEGTYTVRVIEPITHDNKKVDSYSTGEDYGKDLLKTYYPQAENADEANSFELFLGQEQTSINVTLPERLLFDVSGIVVLKSTQQPLKNFRVSFFKLVESTDDGLTSGNGLSGGFVSRAGGYSSNPDTPSQWKFRSLPKGKYRITASQLRTYREDAKKQPKYPDVSKEIEVIDGDIENLVLEVPVSSVIKGVVVSENGKPLPKYFNLFGLNIESNGSAISEFHDVGKPSPNATKKNFTISKLTAGKIQLRVASRRSYITSVSVNGRSVENETVEIEEGETLENVEIVLGSEMGTLRGKVNNFNADIRTAIFLVEANSQRMDPTFFGDVKKNGLFEIKAKPGDYKVLIWTNDKQPRSREEATRMMKEMVENAPRVTVELNEISSIDLDMPE